VHFLGAARRSSGGKGGKQGKLFRISTMNKDDTTRQANRSALPTPEELMFGNLPQAPTRREASQRQWTQDTVHESQEDFRALFEIHPQPMWIYDLQTQAVVAMNAAARLQLGYGREEIPALSRRALGAVDQGTDANSEDGIRPSVDAALRRKDGMALSGVSPRAIDLLFSGRPVRLVMHNLVAAETAELAPHQSVPAPFRRDAGEAPPVVLASNGPKVSAGADIQEMRRLVGCMAHDFNNLLTAILGNIALVAANLENGDPRRELLRVAEEAGCRAAELLNELRDVTQPPTTRRAAVDLNALVDEAIALLRRTLDPRIQVEFERASDLWQMAADAGQLHQILLNLCLNARDAMERGGKLLLRTANVVLRSSDCRQQEKRRPGEFVCLQVADTGCGIAAELLPRIFEPFFTTKAKGKGTGLGLAIVAELVKQHKGWVECVSEPGYGTHFGLFFPRQTSLHKMETAPTWERETVTS
jgi:two-component system cell cycle sensor histidine kinase/response regulator CckA